MNRFQSCRDALKVVKEGTLVRMRGERSIRNGIEMMPRPELHKCVTEQSLFSLLLYIHLHVKVLPWPHIAVASTVRNCPSFLPTSISNVWIDPQKITWLHTSPINSAFPIYQASRHQRLDRVVKAFLSCDQDYIVVSMTVPFISKGPSFFLHFNSHLYLFYSEKCI